MLEIVKQHDSPVGIPPEQGATVALSRGLERETPRAMPSGAFTVDLARPSTIHSVFTESSALDGGLAGEWMRRDS